MKRARNEAPQAGAPSELESLIPTVYSQLRRIAQAQLRKQRRGHTLAPTELVHEVFLRMNGKPGVPTDREHFFAIAAQCMRWILIDYARAKKRGKRDAGSFRIRFEEDLVAQEEEVDLQELSRVLERLTVQDPRLGRIVELRFLGGLSIEETAEVLSLSPATVKRDWKLAQAWLQRELGRV